MPAISPRSATLFALTMNMMIAATASVVAVEPSPSTAKQHLYIGTYTGDNSQGVYRAEFDPATGKLGPAELAAEIVNPSFLNIHPNKRFLYAVSREGDNSGGVRAFSIDSLTGKLQEIGSQSECGSGPCHLSVDPTGKCVLVASYGSGSIAAMPIRGDGGVDKAACLIQHEGSSTSAGRKSEPHAHSINVDPHNRIAIVADLGIDKLMLYDFDPQQAQLKPHDPPYVSAKEGSGPRHFAFHPNGKFAYYNKELTSEAVALAFDAERGNFTELQSISTLPADYKEGNSTAEIQVHPSGKFLYVSNRGHDSIAIFTIDQATGMLKPVGHQSTLGKVPRNFSVDPSGKFLFAANQQTNDIFVFRVDEATGKLEPTGGRIEVGSPVCLKFVPVGN